MKCINVSFLSVGFLLLISISVKPVLSQDSTFIQTDHPKHLTYEKGSGGLIVKQKGIILNQYELFDVLNEEYGSAVYVGRYKTKNAAVSVLAGIGGGLIGFPVGQAIGGGDPMWVLAIAGAGVIAVAIPIGISAGKDIRKGIDIYNESLQTSAFVPNPVLQFGGQRHGVGLSLKF